jgi:hypothetical protein
MGGLNIELVLDCLQKFGVFHRHHSKSGFAVAIDYDASSVLHLVHTRRFVSYLDMLNLVINKP